MQKRHQTSRQSARPPLSDHRKNDTGKTLCKMKTVEKQCIIMLFSSNMQNMASRGHRRTQKRGRPAERTGSPRQTGATAFRRYRNTRGKPAQPDNRPPENRQTPDTSPSRRVFHTVMHKLVHRVIHREGRKIPRALPARENLISFKVTKQEYKKVINIFLTLANYYFV